ncbi:AroM protein [Falsiroseomonas bella]|uniref:AroM protein n=1 Tax=Falsiroseomonas bella TaxID=2184016 RepID=A0A317FEE1_9PROT|nr:AroM family protein [Falsiroseomonas bella]PWS37420.1 AroM protein [Falsiroseomonas bella]
MLQVLVIGQAPRPELAAEIEAAIPGVPIRMGGALDGLTRDEIAALAPHEGADTLFTVLPGGEAVTVSKAAVTRRLRARLAAADGPVLLACTGHFDGLPARPGLVQPSAVLDALAAALLPRGRLGLFLPLPEQEEAFGDARCRDGLEVTTVALRPYSDDAARCAAAERMAAARPDLVLLDCMSYTRRDKAVACAALACPVLLSIAVAARAAASLLSEG